MCGLFTIILGAFGAHVLKIIQNMPAYQTAVQYQSFHSLALILLGVIMFQLNNKYLKWAEYFINRNNTILWKFIPIIDD